MDRHLAYVAMTRHRHAVVLHGAHADFIPEWRKAKLGPSPRGTLSTRLRSMDCRAGCRVTARESSTLDYADEAAFREAAVELTRAPEVVDEAAGSASQNPVPLLDAARVAAGLGALAGRLEITGTMPGSSESEPGSIAGRHDRNEHFAHTTASPALLALRRPSTASSTPSRKPPIACGRRICGHLLRPSRSAAD